MSEIESKKATAWIARIKQDLVAVGRFEINMLLEDPEYIDIIGAPNSFNKAVFLKGNLYPVFNVDSLTKNSEKKESKKILGLVTYLNQKTQEAEYGALEFESIPQQITVSDDMQIKKDKIESDLIQFSKTMFSYNNQNIMVLDLNKIFNYS